MVDEETKQLVHELLRSVREDPARHPLAEIVALAGLPVRFAVDRGDDAPLVLIEPRPDPVLDGLSPRESEVAGLVAAGFSNRQIASALFISTATVKDHVHSILRTTGLQSRNEVAARWYGNRSTPQGSSVKAP